MKVKSKTPEEIIKKCLEESKAETGALLKLIKALKEKELTETTRKCKLS
jgi:hypothetical protein